MLVAVSVLLIVIVGPMTVTSRTAKSSAFASEQVQAFFLAQEGLELAQKLRDDLLLQNFASPMTPGPWTQFRDTTGAYRHCFTSSGCGLYWSDATTVAAPVNCVTVANCRLNYNASATRSKYTYSTSGTYETTPFTRVITFHLDPASPYYVGVLSTVTWRTGSLVASQSVSAGTYLFNIYATE
jgi:hypothetical protein